MASAAPSEAKIRVRLFGVQAERAGRGSVCVRVSPGATTLGDLRGLIAAAEPSLAASLPASRFAVDHAYAAEDRTLAGDEEVALIGLVGGG
ncbi:MoaD/ThiS family protein [Phycisphaera mikurensis]|uniref:MoaD/ThiS family protein n=1 Tax=Phycisphaera mikurensis (strain NBRC 102666 / KCTC 22515 / FYK2301M01) TaxID=1142394 RepID=I0IEF3_PHYMF|nr:MoaD/ThiS family protein [Phycisphaera mikurensis]MBB6441440.1 molybdopterin converting factor small subunit [Phycisphaera mikurensis]BAM03641.1 hypothetical protein PSMK_14820 [Phycisphaera mikurensis NBRC 102666]